MQPHDEPEVAPSTNPNVLMNVGQQTTLTIQYNNPPDQTPTAKVTGGIGPITIGPVVNNGGNSYSVVVTANATGIGTVTWSTSFGGTPMTSMSGCVIITNVASSLTITGPTSPPLGQSQIYTITANGMIQGNPSVNTTTTSGSPAVMIGTVQAQPNGTWTVPISIDSSGSAQIQAVASVNGNYVSGLLVLTAPPPAFSVTPSPAAVMVGQTALLTLTANFTATAYPSLTSNDPHLFVALQVTDGQNSQWEIIVGSDEAGPHTFTVSTTYLGVAVTTTVAVVASNPPTASMTFTTPTGP